MPERLSAAASSREPGTFWSDSPGREDLPPTSPSSQSIFQQILQGRLVGRQHELAVIENLWKQVVSGDRQTLLLSGEAGIGKTRLAFDVARTVESQGAIVLTGRCDAVSSVPYAPVAQIIRTAFKYFDPQDSQIPADILADLLTLAPQLRAHYPQVQPNPSIGPQFEQQRLYDSFVSWCEQLAQAIPILMLIEDIHWADSGTLQLLHHLGLRMRSGHLLLILTYRESGLEVFEGRTLQHVLLDFNREHRSTTLDLPRLNREQTHDLLASVLETGEEISKDFLESIYRDTEGNPFYIEEVCKALIEEGKLYNAGGVWRRSDMQSIIIPKTISAAILSRASRLSQPVQEMLRQAAILGQEFNVETLHRMGTWDEAALENMLENARRAYFIQEAPRGGNFRFTFTHALIPFALRQSLSGLQLQRLHFRAANVIKALQPDDFEVLAHHYTASGEQNKAIYFSLQAAQRAESLYAYDIALHYLDSALNLTESAKTQSRMRMTILEQLADILRLRGERTDAILRYQEALDLWGSLAGADKWVAVRLHRKIGETFLRLKTSTETERFEVVSQTSLEIGRKLTAGEPPHPETVRLLTTLANDAWET
ncbi:MAG: ATP-binding protein, partial [Anaerolineales bacterium]